MDVKTTLAIGIPVFIAFVGYVAAYVNGTRLDTKRAKLDRESKQLAARLDRVNRQLSEMYGPLLAIARAGSSAWKAFFDMYMPAGAASLNNATPEELEKFRQWMQVVQMPLNERLVEVITTKSDLLADNEIPEILLNVCAHVYSYKGLMARWQQGDFSRHFTALRYPAELHRYASKNYRALKEEQLHLLGALQRSSEPAARPAAEHRSSYWSRSPRT
jgi:hypothetical protein